MDADKASLLAHAQVVPVMAALVGSGEGAAQLARFNVSADALYSTRARQKGTGLPSKHALPALVLATLPVKLSGRELMHRPVSTFTPALSAQTQTKAVKIKLAGMFSSQWHHQKGQRREVLHTLQKSTCAFTSRSLVAASPG